MNAVYVSTIDCQFYYEFSGVGKTCLTRQFLYHEFDTRELTTIGNIIHIYTFFLKLLRIIGKCFYVSREWP